MSRVSSSPQAGYSGTPLAKKLGYKAGTCAVAIDAPAEYFSWLNPMPDGVDFEPKVTAATHLVHGFFTLRADLSKELARLRTQLNNDACVWVSWPKKASRVATDISEDVIRELALPLGFVDVKVCAVNEVWSGLKLVVRKELRKQKPA